MNEANRELDRVFGGEDGESPFRFWETEEEPDVCSRHAPEAGVDSAITYRVPLHLDDHHVTRHIRVFGPNDLAHQLDELRLEYAGYSIGTPRMVPEEAA